MNFMIHQSKTGFVFLLKNILKKISLYIEKRVHPLGIYLLKHSFYISCMTQTPEISQQGIIKTLQWSSSMEVLKCFGNLSSRF